MINLLIDNPGTPDAPEGSPTEAEILARLAACTRDICADCGCEEYCVDYLRARLADFAATLDAPEPLESLPLPCATCGSVYPPGDMTNCDECDASLCPYDARTITSEDVICPTCYDKYMDGES